MEKITLLTKEGFSSEIVLDNKIDGILSILAQENEIVVLMDSKLKDAWGDYFPYYTIFIESSESLKTLSTVEMIVGKLLAHNISRSSVIVNVGGGIVSDIGSFVAAIYKRGIKTINIPTTLLAQVDASVGGKNGVNFSNYKNILGLIRQPSLTYISIDILKTLSYRDFMCGVTEMLKIFLLFDGELYSQAINFFRNNIIKDDISGLFEGDNRDKLLFLISQSVKLKRDIVQEDVNDNGKRRLLNFGHTFGHSIEKYASENNLDILHGEAVSIGIVIALRIAVKIGLMSDDKLKSIVSDFKTINLPTDIDIHLDLLAQAINNDKKIEDSSINFVLLTDIGESLISNISITQLIELANDLY